ncbi:MAG: type II secretion system major pseudopilin GspG [Pirellulales bacterium]|nr:type II secretion system major pseudopilin GspG [Pirellulales bacterium]
MSHNDDHPRRCPHPAAFTLIEVLLVLVILVVLGSLAVNQFGGAREKANINAAKSQIGFVKSGIELYQLDFNQFPNRIEDLWEKPADTTLAEKWTAPYLDKLGADPWGNDYMYEKEGKRNVDKYDFWSKGPDGKSGTDDDIGNWNGES